MKYANLRQRVNTVNNKVTELMNLILNAKCGKDVDFDRMMHIVCAIQSDELDLISIICEYETGERRMQEALEVPNFMNKHIS